MLAMPAALLHHKVGHILRGGASHSRHHPWRWAPPEHVPTIEPAAKEEVIEVGWFFAPCINIDLHDAFAQWNDLTASLLSVVKIQLEKKVVGLRATPLLLAAPNPGDAVAVGRTILRVAESHLAR